MRSDDDKENTTLTEKAKQNKYYSEFLGKLDAIMALHKETTGETPKLFIKINDIIRRHNKKDYDANRAAMKELWQLFSRQNFTHSSNPIKEAKKFMQGMGLDVSTHSHGISNSLYTAFKCIDLSAKEKGGIDILENALNKLTGHPVYRK